MAKEKADEAIEVKEPIEAPPEVKEGESGKEAKAKDGISTLSKDTDLIVDEKVSPEDEGDFKPLFDEEEDFDETQLSGEEEAKATDAKKDEKKSEEEDPLKQDTEKKPDEKKEAVKTPEEVKAEEEAAAEAKEKAETDAKATKDAEEKAAKEKADKKPPEGYVPHAALHETRELLKEEKAARKALEAKVEGLVAEKKESPPELIPEFKILNELELDELIDDDPAEAMRYQAKLQVFNTKKAEVKEKSREQQREAESIVDSSVDRINKAVPGIYDSEQSIAKDLADFAIKSGFKDEAFLEVMTNPATVVIPAGTDKRILLSNGAASMIEMLHKIHTSSAEGKAEKVDIEKIREEIRAEETVTLTASITKDLLTKLKPEHVPSEYRSIEDLPGSQEAPVSSTKQYSEADWAKLSEEEQERLLYG